MDLKDRDAKKLGREYSCRVSALRLLWDTLIRFRRKTQRAITKGVVDAALREQ